jgi:hypothetical protein
MIAAAPRLETLDWNAIEGFLFEDGYAHVAAVLDPALCRSLRDLYDGHDELFRSRVVMERYAFGRGEYRYFAEPLVEPVAGLRRGFYRALAPVAKRWNAALGRAQRYPNSLEEFGALCAARGQRRPTPLLLKYGPGDENRLHRDLYGELTFPLQLTLFLSEPGRDYSGGEFALVENLPRAQSRVEVIVPQLGDMVIFPNDERPVQRTRGEGFTRTQLRHGVSRVRSGERYALGIIFHDAP